MPSSFKSALAAVGCTLSLIALAHSCSGALCVLGFATYHRPRSITHYLQLLLTHQTIQSPSPIHTFTPLNKQSTMHPAFTTHLALPHHVKSLLPHSLTPRLPPTPPKAILEELAPPVSLPTQTLWTPSTWRSRRAPQQPTYPDLDHLARVESKLAQMPPLVAPGEMRGLKKQLANVALGHGFVLQGGDCAEDLMETSEGVTDTVRALFKMAVVLMWGSQEPIVKIGRLAGQYGKPRSSDTETRGGVTLPSYRGEVSCRLCCLFCFRRSQGSDSY